MIDVVNTTTKSKTVKDIEREINTELNKVNKEDIRILVSLIDVDETGSNLNVDWLDGSTLLDRKATATLLKQPNHAIAYYLRNMVLSINGWNTKGIGEIESLDPMIKPYENGEYGDGWWFNDQELDCPDINLRTSEYQARIQDFNTRLKDVPNLELGLDWEWHVERNAWYPRVHLNWHGGFNLILLDLDYSYRILKGKDVDFIYHCLSVAISSLQLIRK